MSQAHVAVLRKEIAGLGLDGFIIPRADEHLSEYVPACAERLAWLTGFTGSAGLAIVLAARAALFTDGRYVAQAAAQTDAQVWEQRHITDNPPHVWLAEAAAAQRIGFDPLLIGEAALRRFTESGLAMIPVAPNPIDTIWTERPGAPRGRATPHPLAFSGRSAADKRVEIAGVLSAANQDATVLTDPASIAWLLNIRGADVAYTPFALGFAILRSDARCELFIAAEKLTPELRVWLGNEVSVHAPGFDAGDALPNALAALRGKRVRIDADRSPAWFAQRLRADGATVIGGMDPCLLPKACKNSTEQQGARDAHLRDGVAVCRFLEWLDGVAGHATERSAAARLLALREEEHGFRGESFPAISGAGEHGAIIHYRVTEESDRPIRAAELYLIDSGAQYLDGTTDVTRTVWTGPDAPTDEIRDRFTRVLKGHIAIASAVFPVGVAGPHLDAMARRALWDAGLDFDHGTGHGVGSYLSVHEGPVSLSRAAAAVPIAAGMILSDEPGYYAPGRYGIRLENLLMAQPAPFPASAKPFLRFETLTLAPFDRRCIDPLLLTTAERDWIDAYHARVLAEIGPLLPAELREWLAGAAARLDVA